MVVEYDGIFFASFLPPSLPPALPLSLSFFLSFEAGNHFALCAYYDSFIHSSFSGQLGHIHFLAIMNHGANNMGVHTLVHWKLTIRQPGRMIRHVCTSQWWGHVKRSWLREPGLPGIVQHKHPLQTIHTFTHTLSNPYRHLRSMELILVQEPDFK